MTQTVTHILSKDAWKMLENTNTYLIDVRTQEEWDCVGIPDITALDNKTLQITWCSGSIASFLDDLNFVTNDKNAHMIFICKSGCRSLDAAMVAASDGYKNCYNVIDGFEGSMGWQNSELPWKHK